MHESLGAFSVRTIANLHQAIVNIAMFLPYYFSITQLVKTFFQPWKNVVPEDTKTGSSIDRALRRLADTMISRFMGGMIRGSILIGFVLFEVAFILILPVAYLIILVTIPLRYLFYTIEPTDAQKKQMAFQDFLKRHLADESNRQKVIEWFEIYYQNGQEKPWWSLERLKSQPPLGRDLTSGFTNTLDQYSTELTLQAPHHKHLIGRANEIDVIQRIFSKSEEANVLLNGEEGVGKHAIIEALAKSMYEGTCTPQLAYKRILELDMEKILAQQIDPVKRQEVLHALFTEAESAKNIIICILNIERYISSDTNHVDLTSVFEKFATSKNIQFIVTTSPYLYQKYVFTNKKIVDVFDKVDIPEIMPEQALRILLDIAPDMEKKHRIYILYEAVEQAVSLSHIYMTGSPFPEKAVELLDEACVYAKSHDSAKAVTKHSIQEVLQQKTHVPTELTGSMKQKLLSLESSMQKRVLFQDEALTSISAALRKSFVQMGSHKKPLASFLFLGPTGVGKTETAKALTAELFESEDTIMRFDMSNFQSKEDISLLIGSSESNEPGLLTESIRTHHYGTLLLDELEKAHKDLLNIFLTLLDEGYFTDGLGKKVDCTNLIVVATSNAGADFIYSQVDSGAPAGDLSEKLIDHLVTNGIFAPEFLNRFDGVIVYKPLYKDAIINIATRSLELIKTQAAKDHNITLEFSPTFIQTMVEEGYDPRFGARNLRRLIQEKVEDQIAKAVLSGGMENTKLSF
ncbi:ATP-dependent Clp protease ATP-binding subunit [Candidatus Woesebacteria bacterium]|nr:ATP-dependent Clp protease ATP-binding subunit [Candidatus Woesebacteria bacterium]